MTKLDERTMAKLDVVLENVCRMLPNNGGDHETRKLIARKLVQAVKKGNTSLAGLEDVAHRALRDLASKEVA
jgi:hypothetical protein